MANLLQETERDIKASGHKIEDIIFIGSEETGHECTWDEFKVLADMEYDNGYGGQEVATDIIIVFSDGSKMTRAEYDGSEWWAYDSPFVRPKEKKPIKKLILDTFGGWKSLEALNEEETEDDEQPSIETTTA